MILKKEFFLGIVLIDFLDVLMIKVSGLQRILNDHWYHQSFDCGKLRFVVLLNFFSFFYYMRVGIEQYLKSQINLLKMKPKMDWIVSFDRDCRAFVRVCEKLRHILKLFHFTRFSRRLLFLGLCLYCNVEFKAKEIQPDWSLTPSL